MVRDHAGWPGPAGAPFVRWSYPPTAGSTWNGAELKGTPQRMAHTRFGYMWNWDGNEPEIFRAATDEIGQQQPTREQVAKYLGVAFTETTECPGQQHHYAVEDRQGRERDQWARLGSSRLCCSWQAPRWRRHMAWDALRPRKNSAQDITISPTGEELPPGHGTAKEGEVLFKQKGCVVCHGPAGIGGGTSAPTLQSKKGQDVPIWERERILPLNAPFATIVWDFIHRGMPLGNEGTLTADEVYALTAYLLFLNKVIPEDEVLDQNNLAKVKMPIGDDYARLPDWKPGTPRLAGLPLLAGSYPGILVQAIENRA